MYIIPKSSVHAAGIERIDHHDCSLCGYMTAFLIRGDDVFFDAGCYCTCRDASRPSSFEELADWYNMQSNDGARARLRDKFGMACR